MNQAHSQAHSSEGPSFLFLETGTIVLPASACVGASTYFA